MDREIYDERYTFALPAALKQRLEDEAYRQGKKGSYLCRVALEGYLDRIQGQETAQGDELSLKEVVTQTARKMGMDYSSLVSLILSEKLPEYIKRAKDYEERLKKLRESLQ